MPPRLLLSPRLLVLARLLQCGRYYRGSVLRLTIQPAHVHCSACPVVCAFVRGHAAAAAVLAAVVVVVVVVAVAAAAAVAVAVVLRLRCLGGGLTSTALATATDASGRAARIASAQHVDVGLSELTRHWHPRVVRRQRPRSCAHCGVHQSGLQALVTTWTAATQQQPPPTTTAAVETFAYATCWLGPTPWLLSLMVVKTMTSNHTYAGLRTTASDNRGKGKTNTRRGIEKRTTTNPLCSLTHSLPQWMLKMTCLKNC